MSALKTASHQLLTQLQAAAINPGDVQVALIPFALDVNVGNGNYASNSDRIVDRFRFGASGHHSQRSNGTIYG
jgi:hypothetical protein